MVDAKTREKADFFERGYHDALYVLFCMIFYVAYLAGLLNFWFALVCIVANTLLYYFFTD